MVSNEIFFRPCSRLEFMHAVGAKGWLAWQRYRCQAKHNEEKAVRGMCILLFVVMSNVIGDVKSCHSTLILEIFVGDD